MDWVAFFCRIAAGQLEDYIRTAGVGGEEFRDVPDIAVETHPAGFWGVVLRDWWGRVSREALEKSKNAPSAASNVFAILDNNEMSRNGKRECR